MLYVLRPLRFNYQTVESLPLHKGGFFMFIYALSIFLTSTAFVVTHAK